MFNYKCDKCHKTIFVDPGEERICDECLEMQQKQSNPVKINYSSHRERDVCYAS